MYDQGGSILFVIDEDTTSWVKTGNEFFEGETFVVSGVIGR